MHARRYGCGERTDRFLSRAAIRGRGRSGHARSARGDRRRPAGRHDLPRALSLDRTGQQADPGVGRRDRAAGRSTAGRQADRGLGPSDVRRRAALRAVAGDLPVSADPGAALVRAATATSSRRPIIPASGRRARIPIWSAPARPAR